MPVDSDLPVFCSGQPDRFGVVFCLHLIGVICIIYAEFFFFDYEGVELSNGEKHRFSAWNGACGTSNLRLDCVKGKA